MGIMNKHGKPLGKNMTQSKSPPGFVIHVLSYRELEEYARAFAAGHLNLLVLCGDPGLGKSQCLRRAVGNHVCWISGNASAFGIYLQAHEHRNQPLVLDDVDGLYRDRQGIRLLKSLCQTDEIKTIAWNTAVAAVSGAKFPREFTTTSRVAIIVNQWRTLDADVAALQDRGHCLQFAPGTLEVHRQAAAWYWDQEIFDYVAEYLHLIDRHSLRTYVLASELKRAGMDWRHAVLSRCLTGLALEVAKLQADPSLVTTAARVRAFIAAGLGSRASYFNHLKKLQPRQDKLAIKLTHTSPLADVGPKKDFFDVLRRRYGQLGNG
jgi:hypothetical protein